MCSATARNASPPTIRFEQQLGCPSIQLPHILCDEGRVDHHDVKGAMQLRRKAARVMEIIPV
jgi:hypothetical protein